VNYLEMKLIDRELSTNLNYANNSASYLVKKKTYEYQYAPLYAERLMTMRNLIAQTVAKRWPNFKVVNLVDLEKNERSIVIGTLYKEMPKKPNILKELADDDNNMIAIQPVNTREKFIDLENDQLILEDEMQRILLIDPTDEKTNKNIIKSNRFCTGLVVAFLGYEDEASKFVVEDYCFKETPYPVRSLKLNADKYLVFMSGIELGDSNMNENIYKLQLFIDFINGDFLDLEGSNDPDKSTNVIFIFMSTTLLFYLINFCYF
jgi:DNA polymerase delta subunit 2